MDIVLHWELTKLNFVNQEKGKSSKYKMGCKPSNLELTTTISIDRRRIDLKFKKMLERALYKAAPALHRDMRVKVFTDKLYILSARDLTKLSNEIANVMILHKGYINPKALDKMITGNKLVA